MTIIPTPVRPLTTASSSARPVRRVRDRSVLSGSDHFRAAYPDFVKELVTARSYKREQLAKLRAMPRAGQHAHVRRLLRDGRLHRLYAYDALRKTGRLGTATPQSIEALATRCNVFAPVRDEHVVLRWIDKGSGRRWVHDFGPRRRMQQALVADILRYLHPLPRTQTLFNGGMPAAKLAVATAYREGLTHGVEVDFVDFYGSIRFDRLAELLRPLPATVVEHVVWDFAMRTDPGLTAVSGSTTAPTSSGSTGLSLGAATSPIVGELLIARLLAVAQLPRTISYADNLFVMSRSAAEVEARIHQIREGIASLDAGPLELREGYSGGYDLTRSFEFLKQEGHATAQGFRWQPAIQKIEQYMISAVDRELRPDQVSAAERRIRQWRRSYPEWVDGDAYEAEYLAALAARRFYADRNPANLSAAVHAVVVATTACAWSYPAGHFVPTEGDPTGEARARLLAEVEGWFTRASSRCPRPTTDRPTLL